MIDEKKERISILLFKCITGNITEEEQQVVDNWRKENEANERLYSRLMDTCYLEKNIIAENDECSTSDGRYAKTD